jgi:hypothetical protein
MKTLNKSTFTWLLALIIFSLTLSVFPRNTGIVEELRSPVDKDNLMNFPPPNQAELR